MVFQDMSLNNRHVVCGHMQPFYPFRVHFMKGVNLRYGHEISIDRYYNQIDRLYGYYNQILPLLVCSNLNLYVLNVTFFLRSY